MDVRGWLMAGGRIGLGVACLSRPELVLRTLGFPDDTPTTRTFARMLGIRDMAVALALLGTAGDERRHRRLLVIAGLIDVGDAVAIAGAAAKDVRMALAAKLNVPMAAGSAAFSFWTASRR